MPVPQPDKETIELWPVGAPGAIGSEPEDRPSLTLYSPPSAIATGSAVVVLPGGGYCMLADHEGRPVAEWLSSLGIFAAVLQYRLAPRYQHPSMLADGTRAMRLVRFRAAEWGIDANRIGILGFSAGGHLTATTTTLATPGDPEATDPIERVTSRPALSMPLYAVLELDPPYNNGGSTRNLLGENPSRELVDLLTPRLHVDSNTPPTFLMTAVDDTAVPAEGSYRYAMALSAAKVPYQILGYEKGGHGFGLGIGNPVLSRWTEDAALWLRSHGF
jgi:acetyl esterase/lipase